MATTVVLHHVKDYQAWRKVYVSVATIQRDGGVTAESVYQAKGDPNNVLVLHRFATMAAAEAFFASLGPAIEDVLRTYNDAFGTRILSCLQDADEYIIAEQSADGVRSKCKIKLLPFDPKTPDIPARLSINRTVKGKSVPDESQTLEFDQNSRGDIEVQRLGFEREAVVQEILKPWLESL